MAETKDNGPDLDPIIEQGHDLKTETLDTEGHDLKTHLGDKAVVQECKGSTLGATADPSKEGQGVEVSTKMNEKVKFEVVGLFQQGLVSQALGGRNRFRQKLESTLKDAYNMQSDEPSQKGKGKKSPKQKHETKPQRIRSRAREEEGSRPESETSNTSSPRPVRRISSTNRASPTPRRPAFASIPHRHRPRTGYRRNTVTSSLPDEIGQRLNRYGLSEHQRETIITDLRSLVSNQVVSTTLEGEFRGTLELHLRGRAERIEDGMAPEDILDEVQRQTGTQRVRPATTEDASNFTATASIPVSSGNSQAMRDLSRQVEEMHHQMSEMQRMMRVSFEVQQYVQRSIRQEVAACMQAWSTPNCGGPQVAPVATINIPHTVPNATASGEPTPGTVVPAAYGTCVVCTQNQIDSVVYKCGHMCVCQPCGYELIAGNHKCPMCRSPIIDIVRVYKTSA